MISILTRDINGARNQHHFEDDSAVYAFALTLTEEDEILTVMRDGGCLYSTLSSRKSLTPEDLLGFFG